MGLSGISPAFARLSRSRRQITHALLTLAPLYSGTEVPFLARLACVRHAASVRSEPGSNSPVEKPGEGGEPPPFSWNARGLELGIAYYLVFKDPRRVPAPEGAGCDGLGTARQATGMYSRRPAPCQGNCRSWKKKTAPSFAPPPSVPHPAVTTSGIPLPGDSCFAGNALRSQ